MWGLDFSGGECQPDIQKLRHFITLDVRCSCYTSRALHFRPWNLEDTVEEVTSSIQASFIYPLNYLHLANAHLVRWIFTKMQQELIIQLFVLGFIIYFGSWD